ncbi:MAG: glycosyltransferase family 1 protein [Bdellovibrionota bacterium]
MKIAVNALFLRPGRVGGTERYLLELLQRLGGLDPEIEWLLAVSKEAADWPENSSIRRIVAPVQGEHRVRRSLIEQAWLPRLLERENVSLCWNPGATFILPTFVPQVTTIHDCLSRAFPKNFGFIERLAVEAHVRLTVKRARRIIVPSNSARDDLVREYAAPGEKIEIVPHAAGEGFSPSSNEGDLAFLSRHSLAAGNYFLSVASLLPHKNLPLLLRAYAKARQNRKDFPLLAWTGPGDPKVFLEWSKKAGVEKNVRPLGWTGTKTMPALYRGSRAVLLSSAFEGFGLAALEALACGAPLLSTPCAAVREVVGSTALLADSFSEEELAAKILRIASDEPLRARLASEGPRRAAAFSWEESAKKTLAALHRAA